MMEIKIDGLVFTSNFDSGNLARVERVDASNTNKLTSEVNVVKQRDRNDVLPPSSDASL